MNIWEHAKQLSEATPEKFDKHLEELVTWYSRTLYLDAKQATQQEFENELRLFVVDVRETLAGRQKAGK